MKHEMREETYPFVMRPLPYEYDALMPVIDEETLHFHHDKHYKTYVDNLNNILADYPELQQMSLRELLTSLDRLPNAAQTPDVRIKFQVPANNALFHIGINQLGSHILLSETGHE